MNLSFKTSSFCVQSVCTAVWPHKFKWFSGVSLSTVINTVSPFQPHLGTLTHQNSRPGFLFFCEPSSRSHLQTVREHRIPEERQESLSMFSKKRWAHHSSKSMGTKSEKKTEIKPLDTSLSMAWTVENKYVKRMKNKESLNITLFSSSINFPYHLFHTLLHCCI